MDDVLAGTDAAGLEITDDERVSPEEPVVETVMQRQLIRDVYAILNGLLIERGVPADQIAYIHDAKTPTQRDMLFTAMRKGEIAVLLGSTEKMGTGMNVQDLLIAVHHADAPWRPSDLGQRNGRLLRPRNRWPQVFVFYYVVEGSFDGFIWGTLEVKERFITQIMRGNVASRSAEDVHDTVLTFAQVKALASGNPLVMQKVAVETELTRLSMLLASWLNGRGPLQWEQRALPDEIEKHRLAIVRHTAAQELFAQHAEEDFSMTLVPDLDTPDEQTYLEREPAGKQIRLLAMRLQYRAIAECKWKSEFLIASLGHYKGFTIIAKAFASSEHAPELWMVAGTLEQHQAGEALAYAAHIGDSDLGTVQSMAYQIWQIPLILEDERKRLVRCEERTVILAAALDREWEHAEQYAALQRQLAVLNYDLLAAGVEVDTGAARLPELPKPAGEADAPTLAVRPDPPVTAPLVEPARLFDLGEVMEIIRGMQLKPVVTGMASANPEPVIAVAVHRPEPVAAPIAAPIAQPEPERNPALLQALEQAVISQNAAAVFGQVQFGRKPKQPKKAYPSAGQASLW